MFDMSVLNVTDAELETLASKFSEKYTEGLNQVARKNPALGYAYSEDMCNAFAFGCNCMHQLLAGKIEKMLQDVDAEMEKISDALSKEISNAIEDVNNTLATYDEDSKTIFVDKEKADSFIHKNFAEITLDFLNALGYKFQSEEKPVPAECVKRAAEAENLDNPESNLVFNVTMFRVLRFINRAVFAFVNQDDTRLGRYYLKNAAELLENHMIDLDMLDDITVDVPDCQLMRTIKGHIIAAYRLLAIKEKEKARKHLDLVRSFIKKNFKPMELEYRKDL